MPRVEFPDEPPALLDPASAPARPEGDVAAMGDPEDAPEDGGPALVEASSSCSGSSPNVSAMEIINFFPYFVLLSLANVCLVSFGDRAYDCFTFSSSLR